MSDNQQKREGQAAVMWVLATENGPMTVAEVADELEMGKASAGTTLVRTWRKGYTVRRKLEKPGSPYEYAIRPRNSEGGG